jgi:cell division protein FtsL
MSTSAPIKFRHILLVLGCIALVAVIPLFEVWKQAYLTRASVTHTRLQQRIRDLEATYEGLSLAMQKYGNRNRIEKIARQHCDMRYPSSERIIVISPSSHTRHMHAARRDTQSPIIAIIKKSFNESG